MLSISENAKTQYLKDNTPSELYITIDGTEYTPRNILSGSVSITESLFSGEELDFSAVEKNSIEFTFIDEHVTISDLMGKTAIVKQTVTLPDGTTTEDVPLGTYTITNAENDGDYLFKCTAYDGLTRFDRYVDEWWEGLTFPITVRSLLISLCSLCGVSSENIPALFCNSEFSIARKPSSFQNVTGAEILGYIQEASASFLKVDRSGSLRMVNIPTDSHTDQTYDYRDIVSDFTATDFTVPTIDKVHIKNSDNDIGFTAGEGNNEYAIVSNPIFFSATESEGIDCATNIYSKIHGITYRPFEAKVKGLPFLEVGDVVYLESIKGKTARSPIFYRVLNGARLSYDSLRTQGSDERKNTTSASKEIRVLNRRTHEYINTVDEFSSTITDLQGEVESQSSQISQTVEGITLLNEKTSDLETAVQTQGAELSLSINEISSRVTDVEDALDGVAPKEGLHPHVGLYPRVGLYPSAGMAGYVTPYYVQSAIEQSASEIQASVSEEYTTKQETVTIVNQFNQDLNDFTQYFSDNIADLRDQIDGSIDTWFYNYAPTLNNAPASSWTTDALKKEHVGDMFYQQNTGESWRFVYNNNTNQYEWATITDTAATQALAIANLAKDTADGKRRVFIDTPNPPYDEGDLWMQGSGGDILTCTAPKTSNQYFSYGDWSKLNKYTDDTYAEDVNYRLVNNYPTTVTVNSLIDQKSDEILSTVSANYRPIVGLRPRQGLHPNRLVYPRMGTESYATEVYVVSRIDQKADSITASIEGTYQTKGDARADKVELSSRISMTADQIQSTVSRTYETKNNATTQRANLQSQITQNATSITTKVSQTDYNGNNIVSMINQTAASVQIQASHINLTGYVTATSLNTAGATTINGANISTGTLSADKIRGGTLTLGGSNDVNGELRVNNANGEWVVWIDHDGLWVNNKGGAEINAGAIKGGTLTLGGSGNASGRLNIQDSSGNNIIVGNNAGLAVYDTSGTWTAWLDKDGLWAKKGRIYEDVQIDGTLSVSQIKGSLSNGDWGINFTNGTMSIGDLTVGHITGSISTSGWEIDFDNGSLTIGSISADSITAGTIYADSISVGYTNSGGNWTTAGIGGTFEQVGSNAWGVSNNASGVSRNSGNISTIADYINNNEGTWRGTGGHGNLSIN